MPCIWDSKYEGPETSLLDTSKELQGAGEARDE